MEPTETVGLWQLIGGHGRLARTGVLTDVQPALLRLNAAGESPAPEQHRCVALVLSVLFI